MYIIFGFVKCKNKQKQSQTCQSFSYCCRLHTPVNLLSIKQQPLRDKVYFKIFINLQPENKTNYQGVWQKERKTEMKEGGKRGKKRKEKASINPEQITSSGVTSPLSGSYCPQKPEASVSGALAQGRDGKPRAWEDGKLCWETITFHKLRSETQNP